jgi:hypothetical protein
VLSLQVDRVDEQVDNTGKKTKGPDPGTPTTTLYAYIAPQDVPGGNPSLTLVNAAAQFFSQNFPNLPAQPTPGLQKVQDSLESIRLLLNRSTVVSP